MLLGLNYVVSLDLHRVPPIPGGEPMQYIAAALGPTAVIGGTSKVVMAEMLVEVERCLWWKGDRGSHMDASNRFTVCVPITDAEQRQVLNLNAAHAVHH